MNRRTFLDGGLRAAAGCCLAGASRAGEVQPLPSLRMLAGGRPLIGVAVPTHFDKKFSEVEMGLLKSQFDSVTPENCMKWNRMCPQEGEYRWDDADSLLELAAANGQKVAGHTLLFNRDSEVPEWLFRDGGKEAGANLVWKRLEAHVAALMGRYKGKIVSWDVLNEFVEMDSPGYRETKLTKALGGDFPIRLFKLAAELDPAAKLIYNDYSLENPARRKVIVGLLRLLLDRGCRVDVVGSQSHLQVADEVAEQIANTIGEFATLGVKTAITELDVDVIPRRIIGDPHAREQGGLRNPYADGCPHDVLEKQAARYREVFEAVMANRGQVDRVTMWGLGDRHSWLNHWPWQRVNHGLLFDRDAKPKPAFHAVADVLRKG